MGFLNTPELNKLLEDTPTLADLDLDELDALVVCGGQAPMFQFRQNEDLKRTIVAFYEAEKPTALLCHGVAALIDVQLSDGSYLAEGKTVTGFANVEEDYLDTRVGQKVMPYRIEDELRKRGANYIQGGLLQLGSRRAPDHRPAAVLVREGGRAGDRRTGFSSPDALALPSSPSSEKSPSVAEVVG